MNAASRAGSIAHNLVLVQEISARDQAAAGSVSLPDGRRLSYLSVGPGDGALVLYLHGAIGSPQSASAELHAVTDELRIRYVMVGRPGFGGSDPAPGRTLLGFAHDAAALADALGHARFGVVGVSAGGPYALACAHELPARVAAAAVVSSMAPGACPSAGLPLPARLGLRAVRARPRSCARAADALLRLVRRHRGVAPRPACGRRARRQAPARRGRGGRGWPRCDFLAAADGGVGGMIEDYLVCCARGASRRSASAGSSTSGTACRT